MAECQSRVVLCVFDGHVEKCQQALGVILDNAFIDMAKRLKPYLDLLGKKGMVLFLAALPPRPGSD